MTMVPPPSLESQLTPEFLKIPPCPGTVHSPLLVVVSALVPRLVSVWLLILPLFTFILTILSYAFPPIISSALVLPSDFVLLP